ncbi:hypothetical protein HK100_004412 [Physocladia obscura]|uniref:HCP-like protein n=1 Tax=Physocladia obscura TaxID=109957 RepID=A0AAD5SSX8_9FUNG|nr:hypothetical protein HK100_004412 [Physocladia obscura]
MLFLPCPDLLPPEPIIELMHENKKLSIPCSTVYTVVRMVQASWVKLTSDDSTIAEISLSKRILEVCTLKDFVLISTMIFEQTDKGKPLGFKMLEMCKNQGNLDAEFKYAHALSKGFESQPRDIPKSLEILKLLVSKKHALSTYIYALRLIKQATNPNIGFSNRPLDSVETASASVDSADTVLNETAKSTEQIDIKMLSQGLLHLYKAATELLYPQALMQLGHLYLTGTLGVQKDAAKAYELFEKAANKDIVEAMFLCGSCWEKGEGVEGSDMNKAIDWWMKAANRGLAIAQHNIAATYFSPPENSKIAKSIPIALEYFEMAAMQNLQLSLMNLAKLYKEGYVPLSGEPSDWKISVDVAKARQYVEKVAGGDWDDIRLHFLEEVDTIERSENNKSKQKRGWLW